MTTPISLGTKIRYHRKAKGFSLDTLATLSGTSKSYLWEIENRERLNPSGELVAKIAKPLGLTVDFLLSHNPEPGDEVQKEVLYRNFKNLTLPDQRRILQIIDLWSQPSQSTER